MIWFIIAAAVALGIFIFFLIKFRSLSEALSGSLVIGCIAAGGIAFVLNIVLTLIITSPQTTTHSLGALQDGGSVNGSFFLGSGYVNEQPVFSYYEKSGGAYYFRQVAADHSRVVESDKQPHVVKTCSATTESKWLVVVGNGECIDSGDYTFYVPKGSVVTNYVLDAK